jgi:hypothetical protein
MSIGAEPFHRRRESSSMRSDYTRDELIKYTCVGSDLLELWEEAKVFQINEGGQYTLRHLIQAVICDRLYRLGIKAPTLRVACRALDLSWQSGVAPAFSIGQTNLWVSFSHSQVDHQGAHIEVVGPPARAEPFSRVVSDVELLSDIRHAGRFGIVMNLTHIVRDVEERTGDTFAP